MKLLVPMLAEAWEGQLQTAQVPFITLSRWSVPFLKIFLGVVLAMGYHTRLAVVMVMGIMSVATYVHIVVDDPALFPLQPSAPIIPLLVTAACFYLLWSGAGAWSLDRRSA